MRERIDVQSLTISVSDAGDRTETWTTLVEDEPASFEPTSGGEGLRGRQVEATIAAVFVVHYRTGYEPTQKVMHEGIEYGVVYVKPIEGGKRYLELHCRANGEQA
jgi:SPP1 family predicted phage head-tail adaptor